MDKIKKELLEANAFCLELTRENNDLKKRLAKMQKLIQTKNEEIRKLRLKAGAKRVGPVHKG